MGNILGYSYDNIGRYGNNKRIRKHKKLLKDLCYQKAKEVLGIDYPKVKFRFSYKSFCGGNSSRCAYYRNIYTDKKMCIIKIDLQSLTQKVFYGYNNIYYKCRSKRVNPFIIGNRKKARLFVIYHELAHAKSFLNNKNKRLSRFRREVEADILALSKIKGI